MPEFKKKIAGIILSGEPPINDVARDILKSSKVPYFKSKLTSMECISLIKNFQTKLDAKDTSKIEFVKELADRQLDMGAIESLLR